MRRSIIVTTILLVAIAVGFVRSAANAIEPITPGTPAPMFSLTDESGATVSLDAFRGKIVVLEWTNPECPFVRRHYSAKTMETLAKRYREKGVVWLAINSSRKGTQADNRDWKDLHRFSYPILDDRSGVVGKQYGARTTPHMFVIGTDGRVAYQGAIDSDAGGDETEGVVNYVERSVEALLAGTPVETPSTKAYGCSVKYAS